MWVKRGYGAGMAAVAPSSPINAAWESMTVARGGAALARDAIGVARADGEDMAAISRWRLRRVRVSNLSPRSRDVREFETIAADSRRVFQEMSIN
jgi:hypothetical protein